jgi:putative solute:sodium symporter small subunit
MTEKPDETAAPASATTDPEVSPKKTMSKAAVREYWAANLRLLTALLIVWFMVSFLFSIVFVDDLNRISFFGFKLGFWFAQQGSIIVFVILIFVYSGIMKRIERQFGVEDES